MTTESASMPTRSNGAIPLSLAVRLIQKSLGSIAAVAILLVAWYVSSFFLPEYIFPGLGKTAEKLHAILSDQRTYLSIAVTLQRILGGFFLSALFGVCLGLLIAAHRATHAVLMPWLKIVSGIPALTWVLLSIIWFKSAEFRVWFITFVLVFPIVAINTFDGVRSVPAELHQMVQSLHPTKSTLLRLLIVPAAMPFIFTGLRVSLSFGGRIAVFAEALSASSGIGAEMYAMNQTFDTAGIMVWTALLIAVLTLMDVLLSRLERHWFRWRTEITN
ncbi:ABC transporter permease [Bradyrhizobium diazoefficiens]|uniref:ABC transporter permease n=1 Tax=Bradyrhizobium diazoefficiens TaxID=1355477 RepID=UPI003492C5D3